QQRHRLLLDHGDQAIPHDLHADVHDIAHRLPSLRIIRIDPSDCTTASNRLLTIVAVSRSTITTGPVTPSPGASASRAMTPYIRFSPLAGSRISRAWPAATCRPRPTSWLRGGICLGAWTFTDQVTISISNPSMPSIARPKKRA